MGWLDDLKKKAQQGAQQAQSAVQQGVQAANQAYNTGKQVAQQAYNTGTQVANQVKQNAPGVASAVQDGIQQGAQKANAVLTNATNTAKNMVQNVKNGVENAIATGKEMYNVGKAGYEGAVSGIKDYYAGDSNTQAPPQETDWAAEYDKVMQGGQGTSAPTQSNTPTSSTPATNPDGTVTVTQPNGQPINTSPAANAALGAGAGQWQSELDGIMNQIMNREKFSFDMNGDAMYQQYADMYQNQANLGMQNAMAQAAALTGGYGSSYGQMVGQQAYAQQMQGLNDVALDLYDRAYNQYQDEGNQLAQQYAMIADREQQAYDRAVDDRNVNYQKYLDELNQSNYEKEFEYQQNRDAVADERYNKEFEYQQNRDAVADERYNKEFEYQQNRDAVADERYNKEFEYQQSRDEVSDSQWQQSMDYQKYLDELNQSNYEKEFEYQQNRDAVADERYNKEFEYQQNRDTVADERYNKEFEYQQERDAVADERYNKEFEYQQERDAVNDSRYEQEWTASEEQREIDNQYRNNALAEDQRQFDESMDWQAEEWDKMYGDEGFYTKQNAQDQANWEKQWNASEEQRGIENKRYDDALAYEKEANNPNTTYEGDGTLKGQSVPKQLAGVSGLTTTNTGLFDDNGHFKTAAVVSGTTATGDLNGGTPEAGKGTMTYNIGGKEVTLKTGTSPYTNTVNPDAKNGVMENGYQPDNIGGVKVEEGNTEALVNGQWVPTYTTKDGKTTSWYYDAANNKYEPIPDDEEEKPEEKPKTNESGDYKIGAGGGGGSKKPVYIAHD